MFYFTIEEEMAILPDGITQRWHQAPGHRGPLLPGKHLASETTSTPATEIRTSVNRGTTPSFAGEQGVILHVAPRGPALQTAPLACAPLRFPCPGVSFKAFPVLDSVYIRLPHCSVALIADHAASCDVSLVVDHATAAATAAKASALQAVRARALQEALAAELGTRRCRLSAAAQRRASHV